jgi:hypothetical protein
MLIHEELSDYYTTDNFTQNYEITLVTRIFGCHNPPGG